jgi:hypothetical protein
MTPGFAARAAHLQTTILTSRGFLLAIGLLLVNDWVLKSGVGSWWTGKLSDFAGLYAFPLFWCAFLPKHCRMIFATTAVGFVLWKSTLSAPLVALWNVAGIWPITRVVDYTDWSAIVVLLPSYRAARHVPVSTSFGWSASVRRTAAIASAAIAVLGFAATSRPAPSYELAPHAGYFIGGPRERVRVSFQAHGWGPLPARERTTAADTVGVILDSRTGSWVAAYVELRDAPGCGTSATLMRIQTIRNAPDLAAIRAAFVAKFIEPFQAQYTSC